jgi:hypothetical protein
MSSLTRLALEILEDPAFAPGLKSVACAALLKAFEAGVETPAGSHMAVWRFLLASEGSATTLHRYEIPSDDVARDAVRVLLDPDAGENAQDLALAVLTGPNVAAVTPEEIFTIADRVIDEGRVRRIAWLIERVHEDGDGLSLEFLRALRDRLAGSPLSVVRASAVEVGGLLPRLDEHFAVRMLADPAPAVRAAAADQLEKACESDRPTAIALVRAHLVVEQHRTVAAACYYALGSLTKMGERRIRMWEPPPSGEGEN